MVKDKSQLAKQMIKEMGKVISETYGDVQEAIEKLDTGITYINSSTIRAEIQLLFSGTKSTGNGHREAGENALEIFTKWKSIYVDYSGKMQKAQIEN